MVNNLIKPGYVRFDGIKFITDDTVQPIGPAGPPGPQGIAGIAGTTGQPAFTRTTASFVQPAVDGTVTVQVQSSEWLIAGVIVGIEGTGLYGVSAIPNSTSVVLIASRYSNVTEGEIVNSGLLMAPVGEPGKDGATGATGTNGKNAFTVTTESFIQPEVGGPIVASVGIADTAWMAAGQIVYLTTGGWYRVDEVFSAGANLINLGYTGSAVVGSTVGIGNLSTAGAQGPTGPTGPTGLIFPGWHPQFQGQYGGATFHGAVENTGGATFRTLASGLACTGVSLFWPGGASGTIRLSLWDAGGIRLAYGDVAVTDTGIYTVTFAGQALTPLTLYTVSEYGAATYAYYTTTSGRPSFPYYTQALIWVADNVWTATDAYPTTVATNERYPVVPIITSVIP
jgi:hypothetical protein